MISTRSVGLLIDTVLCLTLAKWETVSGRFGGYLNHRYHHVRLEHHRHKCRDHQVDHYTWEMAPNELPPPRWCRRRGRRPIYWPQIHFHPVLPRLPRDETAVFYTQSGKRDAKKTISRSIKPNLLFSPP